MVTKKQNERSWLRSYAEFFRHGRRELGFLTTKYEFGRPSTSVARGEGCLAFDRDADGAFVHILSEYFGEPWVSMRVGGRLMGLHRQIKRIDPGYQKNWPNGDNLKLQVTYYARFLRKHAREVLGPNPSKDARAAEPATAKRRSRAGGLEILATELGFEDLGSMRMGPITTLIFAKQPVRVEIDLENRGLREVRIKARSKEATLDAALAELAPALVKGLPSDDKARLDYYGAFLRTRRGAALLSGKASAWGRIPRSKD